MKRLFSVAPNAFTTDISLLVARIGITALMLTHGIPKMGMLFSDGPVQFPEVFGLSAQVSLILTVFSEIVCSLLVLLGLGTRLASIVLGVTMAVAAFIIHGNDPFSVQEMSLHFLLVYLILLIAGSGKYSLDYILLQRSRSELN